MQKVQLRSSLTATTKMCDVMPLMKDLLRIVQTHSSSGFMIFRPSEINDRYRDFLAIQSDRLLSVAFKLRAFTGRTFTDLYGEVTFSATHIELRCVVSKFAGKFEIDAFFKAIEELRF